MMDLILIQQLLIMPVLLNFYIYLTFLFYLFLYFLFFSYLAMSCFTASLVSTAHFNMASWLASFISNSLVILPWLSTNILSLKPNISGISEDIIITALP